MSMTDDEEKAFRRQNITFKAPQGVNEPLTKLDGAGYFFLASAVQSAYATYALGFFAFMALAVICIFLGPKAGERNEHQ